MQRLLKKIYLILLLLIISIAIVLFIQYGESRDLIENRIQVVTEVSMKTTVYEINEWINDQSKVIDEAVYFMTFDEWNESVVLDYFIDELHRNKNFKSIYFATPGNKMINGSGWIPPEGFDLRTRIWYQRAIESDETVITDAFLTASGDADIITIAKSVVNQSGELLGVVGGDILLSRIQEIIEENHDDTYGVTFLINSDGQILNTDKINVSEDQFDEIIDESKRNIFSDHPINRFTIVMSDIQDEIGYLAFMPIENSNWFLVNYASAKMIILNNNSVVKEFLIVFIMFLISFALVVIEIKNNITSPFLAIENEMKKIDFEKDPTYRISWNENLGFEKLIDSVNYLLENIENYIEVIKNDQKKKQNLNEELKKMLKQTKTAEKILARQKIDLEVLFNNPNDAVVRIDKNDCIIDINETFIKLFGHTLSEIYGEKLDEIVCNKDTLEDARNITDMVSRGEAVIREGLRYDKNNKPIYALISGIPIIFENKVVGGYTTYKDISDRTRAEKEVTTQKMIFEALFKNSTDSILRFDNNNNIIDINESFTKLFGYELDEVKGKDVDEVVAMGSIIDEARINSEYVKGGNSLHKEGLRLNKMGDLIPVIIKGVPIFIDGKVSGGYGIYTDISLRKKAEKEVIKQRMILEALFKNSSDAIVMFDKRHYILDVNENFEKLFGYSLNEIKKKPLDSVFSTTDNIHETTHLTESLLMGNKIFLEGTRYAKGNIERDVMIHGVPIVLNDEVIGGYGIYTDISERKKAENEIIHMSYHDQLTGLYNRRYFEEEFKRLDHERNLPLALIMADVNGLKLINDAFGHANGDELLKITADIIIDTCRQNEIVARLGGDEFVILLPNTTYKDAEEIVNRIKNSCKNQEIESIEISISFGLDIKKDMEDTIENLFKRVEDFMYSQKLVESPSVRGRMFETIIRTLHEKNKREERHSSRVSELSEKIGKDYGLSDREVFELKSAGWLHDIGKIAINENILNKKGKLTHEEMVEIKRHPEIGYRILNAVNEMSEISEYVLAHHERWDGKGYPKGLSGNQIPLQARIIAVADSFDAMTRERTYRAVLSEEEAIEEIRRNSGTQFDPNIVEVFINKVMKKALD